MSLWDRLLRRKQLGTRAVAVGYSTGSGGERAVGMGTDARAYADEGYGRNVIAYRAVNAIATAVAAIPTLIFEGEDEIEDERHPAKRLLGRVNPRHSWRAYLVRAASSLMIAGTAYTRRVLAQGQVRELWAMRPDRIRVVGTEGSAPMISRYEYRVNHARVETYEADPITGACDVSQVALYHPTDDLVGLSPIGAAAESIDLWNAASRWNYRLLSRSASKKVGLFVVPDVNGRYPVLDPSVKRQIVKDFDAVMGGEENAGGSLVVDGGLEPKELSFSPKDMEWINSKNTSARDVALALGYPPMLLGIPGDNTYSNYQEARRAAYEDTILPVAFAIFDELNSWLSPLLGDARFVPDVYAVPAIARDRVEVWEKVNSSTFLTLNEKRVALGYDEIDDGDVVLIPQGTVPLELALDPPEPEPESAPDPASNVPPDPEVEQERAALERALRRYGLAGRRARRLAAEALPGRSNGHAH